MNTMRRTPTDVSSSKTYCTTGLPPTGSVSFGWPSEIALHRGPMEEELLSAVVADEPEPFVVNDPFDPSLRHNASCRVCRVSSLVRSNCLQSLRPARER